MHNSDSRAFNESLGNRIEELRMQKKMSVRAFALIAEIEHHQLINIEKGRVDIRLSTLRKVARALEITPSELLNL
jgi:transcriptional regulator with XRE-family HTH domain